MSAFDYVLGMMKQNQSQQPQPQAQQPPADYNVNYQQPAQPGNNALNTTADSVQQMQQMQQPMQRQHGIFRNLMQLVAMGG